MDAPPRVDELASGSAEEQRRPVLAGVQERIRERPELILSPLLFVLVVGGWELLVNLLNIPRIVLPAPSAIARALVEGFVEGDLLRHLGITLYETVGGFVIGATFGLVLGALVSQFRIIEKTVYPYIVAFQTLPKVAIAPLIIIWAGYGYSSKIIIAATIAFFPVLANTIVGLQSSNVEMVEMLTAFTASRWQIFRIVKVPLALPFIFAGLDVAIILSLIGAIVGEFVGARAGLGYVILHRNFQMDMPGVFAVLVVLSLMGVGLHLIVDWLHRRLVFWAKPETERVVGA